MSSAAAFLARRVVTASTLVQLGGDDAAFGLVAELDTRADGLNAGRASFRPDASDEADCPAFLVWAAIGARGRLDVRAAGGSLMTVASAPAIVTTHAQDLAVYVPPGRSGITMDISPAADSPPVFDPLPGGDTSVPDKMRAVQRTGDGYTTRVELGLPAPAADAGAWLVGTLRWRSRARAWRVRPAPGAARVLLLVSAWGQEEVTP